MFTNQWGDMTIDVSSIVSYSILERGVSDTFSPFTESHRVTDPEIENDI